MISRPLDVAVRDKYIATFVKTNDQTSDGSIVLVELTPIAPPKWCVRARFDLVKQTFLDDPKGYGLVGSTYPDLADAIVEALGTPSATAVSDRSYHSQIGQDRFVDAFFGGKTDGVFVDVGAHDGVTLSNTAFFERARGWTGLCVEPMRLAFEDLRANRSCACVHAAVAEREGEVDFLEVSSGVVNTEMLSGVVSEYDPRHLHRVHLESGMHAGTHKIVKAPSRRLDALIRDAGIREVDYVSIDTEGSELAVLRSFDPKEFRVKILTIENNYRGDGKLERRMSELGYKVLTTLEYDDVYVPASAG